MTQEALASRVKNSAGMSVGTSLALETILPLWSVFDIKREAPMPVSLHKYSRVWVNLRTVARNLYNAIENDLKDRLKGDELGEAIAEEAWAIVQAINHESSNTVKVVIYLPKYEELAKTFPTASIRIPSTDKQKNLDKLMQKALTFARTSLETNHKPYFKSCSLKIDPDGYAATLMLTHMPVDLLNARRFGNLELLESHTGVVKSKNQWYTKLFAGNALSIIPFCEMSLQIFGDDHSFHPKHISVKREILSIAQTNNWSWMTTESKIRSDILKHPENAFKIEMLKLLHPL